MSADPGRPLTILLLTDVFPPHSGGSGWSTFYLGKALRDRGHSVRFMRPCYGEVVARPRRRVVEYGGMSVDEILIPPAPRLVGRLGLRRAYEERQARRTLAHAAAVRAVQHGVDVLHGGHSVSAVAASIAARRSGARGVPAVSVATVRDYWPLCPSSTRLFTGRSDKTSECVDCHRLPAYLGCTDRSPRAGVASMPLAVAKWAATRSGARELNGTDAVIAVSRYVAHELARSGRVDRKRLTVIPNLVDLPSVERALAGGWPLHDISPNDAFLLFVGKLDENKGARMLPSLVEQAAPDLPLVVAGSGNMRESVAADARVRGLDFRFYDWLDNDSVLLLMSRARGLVFPSAWQEPLSRVLLEGLAAGAAIVALNTGGTPDAIEHGANGWLAQSPAEMAQGIAELVRDDALNGRLRVGARRTAADKFSAPVVSEQVEELYKSLFTGARAA